MAELIDVAWLASEQGQLIINEAQEIADALTAITRLRKKYADVDSTRITQAVSQAALRKKLEDRWNISGSDFLLTEDGLEQASRPRVAQYRAQWIKNRFGPKSHVLDMTLSLIHI